jgi:hypothetical protein
MEGAMPCPCSRPLGLTDERIRIDLDIRPPDTITEDDGQIWHVVAWQRCGAIKYDARCERRRGHPGVHAAGSRPGDEGVPDIQWSEGGGGIGATAMARDATWPVPCWVTTAEEAERWRPRPEPIRQPTAGVVVLRIGGREFQGRYSGDLLIARRANTMFEVQAISEEFRREQAPLTWWRRALGWWKRRQERPDARLWDGAGLT